MPSFARAAQRLTAAALTAGLVAGPCAAAQSASPDRFSGRSLLEALGEIQSRGLRLVYSSDLVRPGMWIETEPRSSEPRAILDELLAPHGLAARDGPQGVLFIVRAAGTTGRIEGVVRAGAENEPIAGAWIAIDGSPSRAVSGTDGAFRFADLRPGEYGLVVTLPGLREQRFDAVVVRPGLRTLVALHVTILPLLREEVVVSPEPDEAIARRPGAGTMLSGDDLRAMPALGGDAQRAAGAQPGAASGDRSAGFSVRGGEPNEILFRLDGQDLYDPFHLKAFHSFSGIIDAGAIGGARFFSEAFPAEYGDRMSGVLDFSSAIPTTPGSTVISTSFVNSRLRTDGRFRDGAGHWLVAARAWYPDAVVNTTDREDEGFDPTYHDLLGKAQLQLSPNTLLTGHFLAARDEVDFTDPTAEERVDASSYTRYAWVTLDSLWGPRLQSRTLLSYGRIESGRAGSVLEDEFAAAVDDRRDLEVAGFSQDWAIHGPEGVQLKWGLAAKRLGADYDYRSGSADSGTALDAGVVPPGLERATDLAVSGRQYGVYAAAQLRPTGSLSMETGMRWDSQTYTGEHQVSPRISVVQELAGSSRIRAAWGRYSQSQGVHELQIEDGVTSFFPAQLAEHWIVGFEQEFDHGLWFRAAAYRKEMANLRPRFENLFNPFELLPEFEPDRVSVAPESAAARGIDLTLAVSRGGAFDWAVSYSRSSIEDTIDGRNVPRSWDQPHALRFHTNHRLGRVWELSLAGEYHTGWPTTAVTGATAVNPDGSIDFVAERGPRNGARFPDYRRFDLRVSRHIPLDRSGLTVFLEVTNLLDRRNVCCVEGFELAAQPGGGVAVTPDYGYWLPRVPSFGLTWRFDR